MSTPIRRALVRRTAVGKATVVSGRKRALYSLVPAARMRRVFDEPGAVSVTQATPQSRIFRSMTAIVTVLVMSVVTTGCFNTYSLTRDEFAKLQRPDEVPQVVTSKSGTPLQVNRETGLFVRSLGGRRYPVTAFNFKLTASQLVASDRDTLLMTSELDSYEADLLSTGKTASLIAGGLGAVVALIVITIATAGEKSLE